MILYFISANELSNYALPLEIQGSFWVTRKSSNKNIINICAKNGQWFFVSNKEYAVIENNQITPQSVITSNKYYYLKSMNSNENYIVFVIDLTDTSLFYDIQNITQIDIGTHPSSTIVFNNTNLLSEKQLRIVRTVNGFKLINLNAQKVPVFKNNNVAENDDIKYGDVLFIMGLRIVLMNNMMILNSIPDVSCSLKSFDVSTLSYNLSSDIEDDDADITVYNKKDYFVRSPRFKSKMEQLSIKVDPAPENQTTKSDPFLLTIGPMMTMATTSVVMLYTSINSAIQSGKGISSVLPQIVMSGAMLTTMLVWPLITKAYNNHKQKKAEKLRIQKYTEYINNLHKDIEISITRQRQILMENHISVNECSQLITNKSSRLWERKTQDDDFLILRLGLGIIPLNIDISYPEKGFSMVDDALDEPLNKLIEQSHDIPGAPVTFSLLEHSNMGIMGEKDLVFSLTKSLIMQLLTFYSSDLIKIVIISSDDKKDNWSFLKEVQHNWTNDKELRFFATNNEEIREVIGYLDKVFEQRIVLQEKSKAENNFYKTVSPFYIIVCDNYDLIAESSFINKILHSNINFGFSIIIHGNTFTDFPDQCRYFINVNRDISAIIENELSTENQKEFIAEFLSDKEINDCSRILANTPIMVASKSKGLPESCGLLEIYNTGRVESLNSYNRWKNSDPTISLAAPVGYDTNGELFKLDLHEKYHGPHGLIAGMTGSGKSEFIITFVISMAINYHPNEVSFVLIDYKGGGLALAFENKEMGIRLPHIAGTITNLDINELNRALISIEAELKRRQREFNKAREISGESTIDIYKYQRLYREGVVKEPISHLFLISDEFAELKAQQPEFMDQLISTARIGRSLGVHLILATQKPAGVVNDQIWSNAKFKVCLKVQDNADSKDMIRVPDAAELKEVGRFYLLVGYNDYFAIGQSAYCGMPYIPSDTIKKSVDTNLSFINNIGYPIKNIDNIKDITNESQGEVLLNVVKYLTNEANKDSVKAKQLWLDKIPPEIFVSDLIKKYSYQKQDFYINPIIGEYDNPYTQSQHLFTIPLSEKGNVALYGRAGSGKEDFLSTLIYSSITQYTPQEINFYIVDCGAETLKQYANAPQVGDVVLASDTEKIITLFRLLNNNLASRKKLFRDYGGDITTYNDEVTLENKKPYICVIINGYENFLETLSDLEDQLAVLAREGSKYGILFIISCNGINSIRLRVKQHFNYDVTLQLIDFHDYNSLFGTRSKTVPADYKGRGLIVMDTLYEFQTASIVNSKEKFKYIKQLCENLRKTIPVQAPKIPSLPDKVDIEYVKNMIKDLNSVPIGVEKESLNICTYNFDENPINLMCCSSLKNITNFAKELWKVFLNLENTKTIFVDAAKAIDTPIENSFYYQDNLEEIIKPIINHLNNAKSDTNGKLVIIINGFDDLMNLLSSETADNMKNGLKSIDTKSNSRFIIIDSNDGLSKYSYDDWMKSIDKSFAIWIGKGVGDQSLFKTNSSNYKQLSMPIGNNMGYSIIEGDPILIKVLESKDITTNSEEVI